MKKITREYYVSRVGVEPENDDLERCNCEIQGVVGHFSCGWNEELDMPVAIAGRDLELASEMKEYKEKLKKEKIKKNANSFK